MKQIFLYGILAEKFGPGPHSFQVKTAAEAASAFAANYPDFASVCSPLRLQIITGDRETGTTIGEEEIQWTIGDDEIHFVPIPDGEQNPVQTVLGVFLLYIGWATGNYGLILTGGTMILGSFFAPEVPSFAGREPVDQRPSSLYSGALNTQEEGTPVPLVYGEGVLAGGKIISASLKIVNTVHTKETAGGAATTPAQTPVVINTPAADGWLWEEGRGN